MANFRRGQESNQEDECVPTTCPELWHFSNVDSLKLIIFFGSRGPRSKLTAGKCWFHTPRWTPAAFQCPFLRFGNFGGLALEEKKIAEAFATLFAQNWAGLRCNYSGCNCPVLVPHELVRICRPDGARNRSDDLSQNRIIWDGSVQYMSPSSMAWAGKSERLEYCMPLAATVGPMCSPKRNLRFGNLPCQSLESD